MERYLLFLLAAIVLSAGIAGVVAAEEGPLAAAGLDQEVGVNTTVQLDGTGSSHPDGRIESYEWSIETPDGRTMTPDCWNCGRTQFTPRMVGRYNVTLTVTDEDGRTDNDTLYIYVEEVGPTVELRGDTDPAVDDPTPYNASVRADGANLESVTWKLGNQTVARESMDGQADWSRWSFSFTEADTYRLVVIASDSSNRTARDTLTVEPRDDPEATGGESGASNGTGNRTSPPPDSSDVGGEPKDERGGYVHEPAEGGGTVTIVHPDHEGELLGQPKNAQIVSANADHIPIRDGVPPSDFNSDVGSSTDAGYSRTSGTASLTGLMGGGGSSGSRGAGSGGSSGSSGGGSSGGAPTGNPAGGGVV
ncbi:hypothetical protein BRC75_07105 [Halobacteriales archaeon QH_7_69_31]|nr:MAG: hypothetical protein BRC75_07105 [Halobacteriales archaeon QH_7_69_31]